MIGCPSTENEFSAWSPIPWNKPLESAATPGLASVTSELTEDDALSSGILSNRPRSTSVWNVESSSIRSAAPPCTSTVWVVLSMASEMGRFTGTVERTVTSCTLLANPFAVTVR